VSERDLAILGVAMHPWGKWGRNFVEYGVVAAHAALADAGDVSELTDRPARAEHPLAPDESSHRFADNDAIN